MLGLSLNADLVKVKDDLTNGRPGYSFTQHPDNGLDQAYLDLVAEAYKSHALSNRGQWNWVAMSSYRKRVINLQEMLLGAFYTACGQAPRAEDLLTVDCENGEFTKCGIYVWNGSMVYIVQTHKAKRSTNREFYIVRFLPGRLGRVAYLYLIWIRGFAALL